MSIGDAVRLWIILRPGCSVAIVTYLHAERGLSARGSAVAGACALVAFPLLVLVAVAYALARAPRWFASGVGDLREHFYPRPVEVPKATARERKVSP